MSALTHAFDRPLRPMVLAVACQEVENRVVGAPCGVMDQVTAALGRESSMLELLCQADVTGLPAQVVGQVAVPDGLTFVGIHSGVRHEVSGDPYTDTRVAAFMAQRMIQRDRLPELTHLVEIQLASFRTSLRHWLPATCGGQAFIDEYQQTNDTVTSVDPKRAYRVRDAACHHVHEHARVTQFVAIMKQISAGEIRLEQGANRAGRLMIASHCSYGQRAHLGHDMTDLLVRLAMQRGPSAGIFGAKITGGGCGGTVALLLRDDDRARQTLASVRDAYHEGTGRESMLFEGTSPGAADLPPQRLAPGEWS